MKTRKYCHRPITKAVLAEKRRRKVENALASLAKRIANGNNRGGKKLRDDSEIKRLRSEGHTMREIAKIIGLSTSAVQRGLR